MAAASISVPRGESPLPPATTSSTLCLWMAPPPAAGGPFPYHHHEDYKHPAHWDLVVAPELFTEEPVGSLLMGTTGVLLQCLRVGPGGP